jgi:maleylpyruvate isomerase
MILHGYWRSGASYRVRIGLGLKGLAYQTAALDLRKGEQKAPAFLAINPQGMTPALQQGETVLTQSPAILEWLEETHPEPPLLPKDAQDRAQVRAMAALIGCDIHPLNNLRVLKYLKQPLGHEQAEIDAWAQHWIEAGFAALEEIAEGSPGPYLFGAAVTMADVCLVPQMYNARRVRADLTHFPRLVAIDKALNALPAVRKARPEAQPDADV